MEDLVARVLALPPEDREELIGTLSPAELREFKALTQGLLEFVPEASPGLKEPHHLGPLVELFESAVGMWSADNAAPAIRATVSTPPQHGKSKLALHALVWMLRRWPHKRHAYVTYAADRAQAMSVEARQIGDATALKYEGTLKLWRTPQGGGIVWTGIGGPLTGFGVDGCMIVDDPVKNRVEAESKLYRDRADQWFRDVAMTRLHPGASVLVIQTRWHEDDLAGRLNKRGWKRINLQAINPQGLALWEEARPLAWLQEQRTEVGEYTWASLFQGEPRPRGGAVFGDVHLIEELPAIEGWIFGIGVDLAYTAKTQSDWSVAVVFGKDTRSPVPRYCIFEMVRKQVKAPEFKKELRALAKRYPGARMRWYAGGTEIGSADFIKESDQEVAGAKLPRIPLEVLPPKGDKFARAIPFAAAWNAGRVLVPRDVVWGSEFVAELAGFTGVNDLHDDIIDAGSAGFDLVSGAPWSTDLDSFAGTKPKLGPHELEPGDVPLGGMKDAPDHSGDADSIKRRGRW